MPLPIWSFQERRKTDSSGDDPLGYGADDVQLSGLKIYICCQEGDGAVSNRCLVPVGFWQTDYDSIFLLRSDFLSRNI